MSGFDFLQFWLNHTTEYFVCLFFCMICLFILFLRKKTSLFNPVVYHFTAVTFANVVFIFLAICGEISFSHIIYFLMTQVLFFSLFYCVNYNKSGSDKLNYTISENGNSSFNLFVFAILLSLFVGATIYRFILNGISIFNENRFIINADNHSGILGLLNRVSLCCQVYILIFSYRLINKRHIMLGLISLLIIIVLNFLCGSKGFVLHIVFAWYFYNIIFKHHKPKISIYILIILFAMPIFVI